MRIVLLLTCLNLALWGQSSYVRISVPLTQIASDGQGVVLFTGTVLDLPSDADPFIAMNLEWRSTIPVPANAVQMSIQYDRRNSVWTPLSQDEHTGNGETRFFSNMQFLDPETREVNIRVAVDNYWREGFQDTLIVHLFDPGPTPYQEDAHHHPANERSDECTCPPPTLTNRAQWCPDGSCLPHPSPEPVFPSHLIIHHSAGSNNSSDWAAVVRSIWNFHVNGNGWSDIGYNWLVDPNGVVYIGRGDNILGAHFCGKNANTLGTCVMGDFTTVVPTEHALASLADLYAWKACTEDIDPLGSSFHPASANIIPNVSGHRQSCSTSCPGDAFFPTLQQVRERIAQVINSCDCTLLPPEQVETTVHTNVVHISWDKLETGGAVVYRILRKGESDLDFITLVETGATFYDDSSVLPGQEYLYQIQTIDGNCLSNPSTSVSATIPDEWLTVMPTLVNEDVRIDIRNGTAYPVRMTLTAVDGRQVWAVELGKPTRELTYNIHMSPFPAGYYILRLDHGSISRTVRLVKY